MFSWEYSEFMRVGVDPASDKSDKASLDIPEHIWSVEDKWWMQYWVDKTWTQDLWGCPVVLVMDPCVLWDGRRGLHRSDLLWHVRWMLQPDLQFPMRSSICCLIPWRSHWVSQLALTPRSLDTGPPRVSRDVWSGELVRDLLSPVGCGLRTLWIRLVLAHLKDAERPLQLGECCCEEGVNSTLSRSLGGWCVLNCIPPENHKVSQHNTAL